jgi:hypothetical protein
LSLIPKKAEQYFSNESFGFAAFHEAVDWYKSVFFDPILNQKHLRHFVFVYQMRTTFKPPINVHSNNEKLQCQLAWKETWTTEWRNPDCCLKTDVHGFLSSPELWFFETDYTFGQLLHS